MVTRADLHKAIDNVSESDLERVGAFLKAMIERGTATAGRRAAGAAGGTSASEHDPFEHFPVPPPEPFRPFRGGGASYSALGSSEDQTESPLHGLGTSYRKSYAGEAQMECWRINYFEADEFVSETQRRFHGHVFRLEERWSIDGQQVRMQERISGPGHDSSRAVAFPI